jgi:hypothetical protein
MVHRIKWSIEKVNSVLISGNKPLVLMDGEEISNEQYKSFSINNCKTMDMAQIPNNSNRHQRVLQI